MHYNQLQNLLDAFGKLPINGIINPTFMEIAGYPHYENVCSNILAFFFNPTEVHGLKDLCLKTLSSFDNNKNHLSNVSVERKVTTHNNNRIDIVIHSDNCILAVENKIFATVYNPLADYASYLKRISSGKKLFLFILSIKDVNETNLNGFIPVKYSDFFSRLRSNLGEYSSQADTKYLAMFFDFITTIENLMGETFMKKDTIKFIEERSADIISFLNEIVKFKSELRRKVSELGTMINLTGKSILIKQWYYRETNQLVDCLVHDIQIKTDLIIAVDCHISASGWKISIFARKGLKEEVRKILSDKEVDYIEEERFIYQKKYPFDEQINLLGAILQDIIDKITGAKAQLSLIPAPLRGAGDLCRSSALLADYQWLGTDSRRD